MSASSSLSLNQLSGSARQLKGSIQSAEGTKQPSVGSSQGVTGSSQLVDGTSRLQQAAFGPSFSPVSTSQESFASAAVSGSPGNITVPPKGASAGITLPGSGLQISSEQEAAADCKAERAAAAAAPKRTAEESRQQADTVGGTRVGDGVGHRYTVNTISSAFAAL